MSTLPWVAYLVNPRFSSLNSAYGLSGSALDTEDTAVAWTTRAATSAIGPTARAVVSGKTGKRVPIHIWTDPHAYLPRRKDNSERLCDTRVASTWPQRNAFRLGLCGNCECWISAVWHGWRGCIAQIEYGQNDRKLSEGFALPGIGRSVYLSGRG